MSKILNLKSVALNEGEVNGKMTIIIVKKNESFNLVSIDTRKDSAMLDLTFVIEKGMKIKVNGDKKGTVSITGFIETLDDDEDVEVAQKVEEKKKKVENVKEAEEDEDEEEEEEEEEEEVPKVVRKGKGKGNKKRKRNKKKRASLSIV